MPQSPKLHDEDIVVTPLRRTALVAGLLYLATFVAGIPPSFLYAPVLTDPSAALTAGTTARSSGASSSTSVPAWPVSAPRWPFLGREAPDEGAALGFVTTRVIEGAMLFIAGLSMLTLVSLRQPPRV